MVNDIIGTTMPHIADDRFCQNYVVSIAAFNMMGRFGWASISDLIGRKNAYGLYLGAGAPLFCAIPYSAGWMSVEPSMAPLLLFYGSTMTIFSFYGGGFATIPAYIADVFGTKYVGGIHGRMLTAWSTAGLVGPQVSFYLTSEKFVQLEAP